MSHYYHQLNRRAERRIRRIKRALVGLLMLLGLAGLGLGADYAWTTLQQRDQKTTTAQTSGYYSAPVKVFRTPFFQFQTDNSWTEVTTDPKANPRIYRRLRDHFVEHELYVYVNADTAALTANRVLPVNLTSTGELLPLTVSEHCQEVYKSQSSGSVKPVNLQGVDFLCDPHDSSYKVVVGLQGGASAMPLQRPDKSMATYMIIYKNITAQPEGSQLEFIMASFQTR